MLFLNTGLTLPVALIIGSLIIGFSLIESGRNNRFKLVSHNGLAMKINSHSGQVELCKISSKRVENKQLYSVTCGESIDTKQ